MNFRTVIDIPAFPWRLQPDGRLLFVGSCFAASVGQSFRRDGFRAEVNPFGVMYNPASVLHTVRRLTEAVDVAFITLGTNHIYRLRQTGEIVDNCQKRPAALFQEEELTAGECAGYLRQAVEELRKKNAGVQIVLTVSPIRYAKYGYHASQLSKATLLLAAEEIAREHIINIGHHINIGQTGDTGPSGGVFYFPAYEIVLDELRDYRFYRPDMLHPSEQAAEYIRERLDEAMLSPAALAFAERARTIRRALLHRPFNAQSNEYKTFRAKADAALEALRADCPWLPEGWPENV